MRNSKPGIDQLKPKRTPLRTFLKLLRHGEVIQIALLLQRKASTASSGVGAITQKTIMKVPAVDAWLQRKRVLGILRTHYGYRDVGSHGQVKVSIISDQADTKPKSSTFIRLISPLTHPSVSHNFSIKLYPQNTTRISASDICIVQRTAFDDIDIARQLVKGISTTQTVLIVDSDDAFNEIDTGHPEYLIHRNRLNAFSYLLGEADRVWLSTPELLKSHKVIHNKAKVIPNSLDERIWKRSNLPRVKKDRPIEFIYMGTATHDSDLEVILPALDSLALRHPDSFKLYVVGVSEQLPSRSWIERLSPVSGSIYPYFVKWFMEAGSFDIGLSPLVDSSFNLHKSDIKCLDYLAIGVLPIVSDLLPYKAKELDEYILRVKNTHKDWLRVLSNVVRNPETARAETHIAVSRGQKYLWENRSTKSVSEIILKEIQEAIENKL